MDKQAYGTYLPNFYHAPTRNFGEYENLGVSVLDPFRNEDIVMQTWFGQKLDRSRILWVGFYSHQQDKSMYVKKAIFVTSKAHKEMNIEREIHLTELRPKSKSPMQIYQNKIRTFEDFFFEDIPPKDEFYIKIVYEKDGQEKEMRFDMTYKPLFAPIL